ncbi:MAG: mechanosensitive ion channel [Flavobacteriales bacterium]|nr:mechanosensitive ion channel [Flavobacteriales bacterium]MBK9076873.1 mechanosensitive ion channel [Flavobacteriales bacterium]MBK9538271.1 mechanosensitive ion channel [Flavobacteriales bacterium]
MDLELLKSSLAKAFEQYVVGIINGLPGVISGLIILLLGWLIAKGLRAVVKTTAVRSGLDGLVDKSGFSKVLGKVGVSKVSSLLAGLVYVFVLLVFIVAAADAMHLTGVTNAISALFAYLPTFFTALAIFLAGLWGAELVKEAIGTMMDSVGLSGGRVLGSVVFGLIVLFTSITALNMAGVDTTLVTSNIVVVLGGILIAFCIAYGFAARDILTNILSSYYGKDRFKVGMRVRIGSDEGVIEKIDSISIAIRTADRLVLLPTKQLITERIEVLGEEAAG